MNTLRQAFFQRHAMNTNREICPECGQPQGVPIIWGKPPSEVAGKVERGEVVCGGCDIWSSVCGTVMNRECQACGHQWYDRGAE